MLWPTLALGATLRASLAYAGFADTLSTSVELSSPITSYRRVAEALFLHSNGHSMYDGSIYHQIPLLVPLFQGLETLGAPAVPTFFIAVDITIAILLWSISSELETHHFPTHIKIAKDIKQAYLSQTANLPDIIAAMYILNPFTMASCVVKSTNSISHLCVCLCLFAAQRKRPILAGTALAFAVVIDVYPLLLLPSMFLLIWSPNSLPRSRPIVEMAAFSVMFAAWTSLLLWTSFQYTGRSWDFLQQSYGFAFQVADLTPNIGVFWYFMTEIFDRFRSFFLICFHGHIFVYVVPLTCRFWRTPVFLAYTLLTIWTIFRSYPVISDVTFSWTFLAMQWNLLAKMKWLLPVYVTLAVIATLSVLMWHLWIVVGSGNANFYYFQTIVFNLLNCYVFTESIVGHRKLLHLLSLE